MVSINAHIYGVGEKYAKIKQVEENEDNIGAPIVFLSLLLFYKFEIVPRQKVQKYGYRFLVLLCSLNLRNLGRRHEATSL